MNFETFAINQLIATAYSMIAGVVCGLIYDIFRVIRRLLDKKQIVNNRTWRVIVTIQDVLFCFLLTAILIIIALTVGEASFRFYTIGGVVVGFSLYFVFLSLKIQRIMTNLIILLAKMARILLRLIIKPMLCVLQFVLIPFRWAYRMLISILKHIKRLIQLWWMKSFIINRYRSKQAIRKQKRNIKREQNLNTNDKGKRQRFTV